MIESGHVARKSPDAAQVDAVAEDHGVRIYGNQLSAK